MSDSPAILRTTVRLTAGAMLLVSLGGWTVGMPVSIGFFLAAAIVVAQLGVLALTVDRLNHHVVGGGNPGLASLALQGRFLLTLMALSVLAVNTHMPSVFAGSVLAFTALVAAGFRHAPAVTLETV